MKTTIIRENEEIKTATIVLNQDELERLLFALTDRKRKYEEMANNDTDDIMKSINTEIAYKYSKMVENLLHA